MSEASYHDLSTPELKEIAQQEAEQLVVDPAVLAARPPITGYAIDQVYSRDRDDAVRVTREGEQAILHVSIADVGSFISPDSAMQILAGKRLFSVYKDNLVVVPMLPKAISEDKLSLLPGQLRPVLTVHVPVDTAGNLGDISITQDTITAQAVTPVDFEAALADDDADGPFALLQGVAQRLFRGRHGNGEEVFLEDEEGNLLAAGDGAIGQFVVQETMIAANKGLARYNRLHRVPVPYRNFTPDEADDPSLADDPELAQMFLRAQYASIALGHVAIRTAEYLHGTSPLRRHPDLIVISNTIAHHNGQELPYDLIAVKTEVRHLRRRAASEALHEQRMREHYRAVRGDKPVTDQPAPGRTAINFLDKIAGGTITGGELSHALFGPVKGDEDAVADLREQAIRFVTRNAHLAREVLHAAVARRSNLDRRPDSGRRPAYAHRHRRRCG